VKTGVEVLMVLLCLLFWAVALALAGLMEVGVTIAAQLEGQIANICGQRQLLELL
jgi:hypothetical protein